MTCDYIVQYVRALQNEAGNNIKTLYRILDDRVEALEFTVHEESRATGVPLSRLHLKKKKFLENFSVAGACSFHGADFCHNDKEAAVNTRRIYKAFAKVRAKIRPSKPMRVRISSAKDSIHPF